MARAGWSEATNKRLKAGRMRLCGNSCAGPQFRGVPVGMAQTTCIGKPRPQRPECAACDLAQQAQECPEAPLDHCLDADYVLEMP